MGLYLISDTHFGHDKILTYENRPFKNIHEMNKSLINNWNSTVTKDDVVICLGDFSFLNKKENINILSKLNGNKELILGNHDRSRSVNWWKSCGFSNVYKYPICIDEFFWLSHEPMYMCRTMPYINIHGHTHSKILFDGIKPNQFVNVCVENIGYRPINFYEIKRRYK